MTHGIRKHLTTMQLARVEDDRRYLGRKVTQQATDRMRTYRQQQAADLADRERGPDDVVPDADDSAVVAGVFR